MEPTQQLADIPPRRFERVRRVLLAIVLAAIAGFSVFLLGMTVLAVVTDGSSRSIANFLYLTPSQLTSLTILSFFTCVSVGAIGSGLVTALWGRIELGPRVQWIIRGTIHGGVWMACACFVLAFLRGDGPSIKWWVYGAEWAIQFIPAAAISGAACGYLAHQLSHRRRAPK